MLKWDQKQNSEKTFGGGKKSFEKFKIFQILEKKLSRNWKKTLLWRKLPNLEESLQSRKIH